MRSEEEIRDKIAEIQKKVEKLENEISLCSTY